MSTARQRSTSGSSTGAAAGRERVFTVSAVTAMVKNAIAEGVPATIHVVGEVSNFKRHGSGHLYFTLKDDTAELSCVMWRSAAAKLAFKPEDGMEALATGYIDVFERAGRYQLYARKIEPRGTGALELAFRQLREKLSAEGLFDERHKRPLPAYPQRIAVVTSPTGAAIKDITETLARRYPCADVLIYPVAVQGPDAARQIAAAVVDLNDRREALGGVDVIIVGRGGGSLEDLWAFNEEPVARAIFASEIPVVSAVGHEVDVTISDLVADVRAATPTAAAELVAPDRTEMLALVERHQAAMRRSMTHRIELACLGLESALRRRALAEPLWVVQRREQVVDEVAARLTPVMRQRLHRSHDLLRRCDTVVRQIQPQAYMLVLERSLSRSHVRLRLAMSRRLGSGDRQLGGQAAALAAVSPVHRLGRLGDRVGHLERRLRELMAHRQRSGRDRLEADSARLSALSYRSTLRRGFSITRLAKGRRVVRSPEEVADGDRLLTETAEGEFESQVINQSQLELFE